MSDLFPPKELVTRCAELVRKVHAQIGYRDLAARIASKQAMVALATTPRMIDVIGSVAQVGRFRMFGWVVAVVSLVLTVVLSRYWLLGLAIAILADRLWAREERSQYVFLSAVLLSLDMLAVDFAAWGSGIPAARDKARAILGAGADYSPPWLDFYLPNRANLDAALIRAFGPESAA
jgi:hypothetical protein